MPRYRDDEHCDHDTDEEESSSEDDDESSSSSDEDIEPSPKASRKKKRNTYSSSYQGKRGFVKQPQKKKCRPPTATTSTTTNTITNSPAPGVYVLRNARTNVCYVGKSANVPERIRQHRNSSNGDVLNRESLLTTAGSVGDLESWERNEVLTRMFTEGMDSVRGWRFTSRGTLTLDEKHSAKNDIMEKFDLCRRCGRDSHFANSCFARSPAFWCREMLFL